MPRLRLASTLSALVAVWLLGPLAAAGAAAAAPDDGERQKIVVYTLEADKKDADITELATQLSDELLLHLGKQPSLTVIGQSELAVMLEHEGDKAEMKCTDDQKCMAKIKDAVKAQRIVTGHLGRMGEGYVVTLRLADTKTGTVTRAEAAQAEDVAELPDRLREAAERLLGLSGGADAGPKFKMEVAPEGTKAAVIDLEAAGVDPGLAQNLTQLLSLELKKFEGLSVISRGEIQTMLRFEMDKQELTCKSDTSCLVEIGGALGVDYLIAGSIGRLGDAYVITLKLMDVHAARVVHRSSESLRGAERDLPLALRFATWGLLGQPMTGKGKLKVEANVDDGKLSIAGGEPLKYAGATVLDQLPVGRQGVMIRADGYHPLYQETYIQPGEETNLRMSLQELPNAWYEEWYTWAIIGGVVAAGVVTAVVLTQQDDPGTDVSVTVR